MKKILVIGSLNMDMVTNVTVIPKVGETVIGNGLDYFPGGKGANQAIAIGKLGGNVSMIGAVGNDENGKALTSNLKKNNVNANNIICLKNEISGLAFIAVNENGDNSIIVIPGANGKLKSEWIKESMIKEFDYIIAQIETPIEVTEYAFSLAKKHNVFTILNPAPALKLSQEIMKNTDMIIPNETEFEILTGYSTEDEMSFKKGIEILKNQGIKEILVTLGKQGVRYFAGSNIDHFYSGYIVDVVDTTSAGDCFIGALVTSLSKENSIDDAIEFAIKASAITVSSKGAQESLPNEDMINNLIAIKRII